MLNFDSRGNLKPYEPIPVSIKEMKKYFVDGIKSETRKNNFERYTRYVTDLKKYSGGIDLKQWVDGSFVTLKANPKDIDVVTFLNETQIKELGELIENFRGDNGWNLYGVDAYIVEDYGQPSRYYSYTVGNTAYWYEQFVSNNINRAGKKFKKGFLEIIY